MMRRVFAFLALPLLLLSLCESSRSAQVTDHAEMSAVSVTHSGENWTISGKKNSALMNETTLRLRSRQAQIPGI
jgi:hypothetical protein